MDRLAVRSLLPSLARHVRSAYASRPRRSFDRAPRRPKNDFIALRVRLGSFGLVPDRYKTLSLDGTGPRQESPLLFSLCAGRRVASAEPRACRIDRQETASGRAGGVLARALHCCASRLCSARNAERREHNGRSSVLNSAVPRCIVSIASCGALPAETVRQLRTVLT